MQKAYCPQLIECLLINGLVLCSALLVTFFLVQISLGVLNEYCYVITYEKLLKFFLLFFYNKNHFVPNKTKDTLYVFFPRFRPCNVTQEKSFFQILSDPREHKCDIIYENLLRP